MPTIAGSGFAHMSCRSGKGVVLWKRPTLGCPPGSPSGLHRPGYIKEAFDRLAATAPDLGAAMRRVCYMVCVIFGETLV